MKEDIVLRIKAVMQHFGLKQGTFALRIGIAQSNLSKILKGERPCGEGVVNKIVISFDNVSKRWLLTGEGDMLKSDKPEDKSESRKRQILYYPDVTGSMGDVSFLDNPQERAIPINIPGFEDCTLGLQCYGESMSPVIQPGQIVLMREWAERFIEWGKIYMVVTRSGHRAVKKLYPSDTPECIECRSINPDFPPFAVPSSDILHLYLVKGWVTRVDM